MSLIVPTQQYPALLL